MTSKLTAEKLTASISQFNKLTLKVQNSSRSREFFNVKADDTFLYFPIATDEFRYSL
jgi:hypothetical protein